MDIERRGKERSPENGQNNFEEDCDEGEKIQAWLWCICVFVCSEERMKKKSFESEFIFINQIP